MTPQTAAKIACKALNCHYGWPRDRCLNDNVTERSCPLDYGKHHGSTQYDLGKLEKLPLELQHNILAQSDLQTVTDFRRVNRRAMAVVDSLHEYQTIIEHSPDSLRGLLSIELAAHITCRALSKLLHTNVCECCGRPSGYIHLLACRRVCCSCINVDKEYAPFTLRELEVSAEVPASLLQALPTMRSIPGDYASMRFSYPNRIALVDRRSASSIIMAYRRGKENESNPELLELPFVEWEELFEDMHSFWLEEAARFMSVVHAPSIQRDNGETNDVFQEPFTLQQYFSNIAKEDLRAQSGHGESDRS